MAGQHEMPGEPSTRQFMAVFRLGDDERKINMIDANGVVMGRHPGSPPTGRRARGRGSRAKGGGPPANHVAGADTRPTSLAPAHAGGSRDSSQLHDPSRDSNVELGTSRGLSISSGCPCPAHDAPVHPARPGRRGQELQVIASQGARSVRRKGGHRSRRARGAIAGGTTRAPLTLGPDPLIASALP